MRLQYLPLGNSPPNWCQRNQKLWIALSQVHIVVLGWPWGARWMNVVASLLSALNVELVVSLAVALKSLAIVLRRTSDGATTWVTS
jgi:hypothetical protein